MFNKILTFLFILFTIASSAQPEQKNALNLSFGYGTHGSGDITGYQYEIQYINDFTNKWSWSIALGGSLHDASEDSLTYLDTNGNEVDATLHNVIAGIQAGFGVRFNMIHSENHSLGFEVIPFLRYQATSLSDVNITIFDPEFPFPVRNLIRLEPARTYAVGASLRLNYRYHIGNNYIIGIGGAFQTDTNGDAILGSLLSVGKRF